MKTNQYSGFHKLTLEQRAAEVAEFSGLTGEEIGRLTNPGALGNEVADHVIENVIGTYQLPVGAAPALFRSLQGSPRAGLERAHGATMSRTTQTDKRPLWLRYSCPRA